jgi:hypothetical protein
MTDKPEALIITWSKQMLTEGGSTLLGFMRVFEALNETEQCWYQKMRNKPKHDVLYCYIIIGGRIMYRANVSHYETGPAEIMKPNQLVSQINWNRLVLTAPIVKAPHKIEMRGFQGFRYTNELFF